MRPKRVVPAILTLAAVIGGVAPARAAVESRPARFDTGQVLVQFAPRATAAQRRSALAAVGGRIVRTIPSIGFSVVRLGREVTVARAVARLRGARGVSVIEPDYIGRIAALDLPQDPCVGGCAAGKQWDIGAINALSGWNVFPGRYYTAADKQSIPAVKVAVLDTKIDTTLSDWSNAMAPVSAPNDALSGGQIDFVDAVDFVPQPAQEGPAFYHGSFVAGIIAAGANNTIAMAGFGYTAQIMPVTVVDGTGNVKASDLAAGIDWAVAHGARVVNLSLGLAEDSTAVRGAVFAAAQNGALVVAAAGNNANNAPFYPAWYPGAMSVSATEENDKPGSCTNFSGRTSVAAPGVGIVSLDPTAPAGLKREGCGTSTAAPHVSALAALLFAQKPERTRAEVRTIIERTADDARADLFAGKDDYYGNGRINFERALRDLTPGLPIVNKVVASFPKASGGASHATAVAMASSASQITKAEWFLDTLGAEGTGGVVSADDGAFDATEEALRAEIEAPLTIETGIHRLYIRAKDLSGTWGPASVGVLVVDRRAPDVREVAASTVAVRILGQNVRISFTARDDNATKATYSFTVSRQLAGTSQTVYESQPKVIALPAAETTQWVPGPTDIGQFTITLTVVDEADNPARATVTTIVA